VAQENGGGLGGCASVTAANKFLLLVNFFWLGKLNHAAASKEIGPKKPTVAGITIIGRVMPLDMMESIAGFASANQNPCYVNDVKRV